MSYSFGLEIALLFFHPPLEFELINPSVWEKLALIGLFKKKSFI